MTTTDTPTPAASRRRLPLTARSTRVLASSTVLALGLAACSGGPSSTNAVNDKGTKATSIEATMAFTLSSGFDPANASSAVATAANAHIFEGLIDLDPATREPFLALAKADPTVSADGLTWTVQLRDGAKFSDGTPVTADDVAHSFTRVLKPADPAAPPLMQGFISFVDSVTAKDATTAEFKLKTPFALFPQRIAVIKIVPKAKTADAAASKAFDTAPIGSGPYKLDSASKESGLKFSKNPNYNGSKVAKAQTLSWNTTTEASARVADLQGGRVQAIEQVPYLNVDSLKGKYDVEEKQAFNQVFLMFNTSAKPFNDKRVRQALHYAIDKNSVIKTALNGFGTPASSYLDEGNANYQKAATVYDYDAAKAKSLLAEAGASNLSFTLDTTDNAIVKDVAPLLVEAWKAIGVTATLNTQPSSAIYGDVVPKDTFRVLAASGDPSVFGTDPDLLMRWFYYGETWPAKRYRWDEGHRTQIAGILDKAAQSTDEAERKTLWKQALDIVADEAPLYPILHTKVVTAFDKTKVDDFAAAPTTGLYFLDTSRKG